MQEQVKYEVSAFFLVNDIEHKVLRHIFRLSPVGSISDEISCLGIIGIGPKSALTNYES